MSAAGAKSANFNMRMDPQTKSSAESLFRELGMTLPQAVNMFIAGHCQSAVCHLT